MLLFFDFKVCYFMSVSTIKYGLSLLNTISFSNSSETTGRNLVNVNSKESSVPNSKDECAQYRIRDYKVLIDKILPIFDKYLLLTQV